jgi:hypothetical protein
MAHVIAMSASGGNLYLAYLVAAQPYIFQQTEDGVWHQSMSLGEPLPPGVDGFASIVGLDDVFIALANEDNIEGNEDPASGGLYYTTQNNGAWSSWAPLSSDDFGPVPFTDFAAAWIDDPDTIYFPQANNRMLMVAAAGPLSDGPVSGLGVTTLCGVPGAMSVTFPLVATISTWGAHNLGQPGSDCISVVSAGQGVGVVFYLNGGFQQQAEYGAYALQCFVNYGADGVQWDNSPLPGIDPDAAGGPIVVGSVVTALGNPDGIIQVLLVTPPPPPEVANPIGTPGQIWLLYCGAEQIRNFSNPNVPLVNWIAYGLLPPTAPVAQVAMGVGNVGNLQVVCISLPAGGNGYGFPYLVWQDTDGNWWPYNNGQAVGTASTALPDGGPGQQVMPVTDMAVGMGWNGGQPALQVGYFGSDGNIYINWQDAYGNWSWYGGTPGPGLP